MDAKEDIRDRLAIEDVVGEYVQLKRAGRTWKGLSPFSSEKTPSFVVSPEKQIWHDFSSGKGGDIFTFIQEMEGVDFMGALEILARRAGLDLDQYKQTGANRGLNTKTKERLYEANELAARFYQEHFKKSKIAYEYVLGTRKFSRETALVWRLGYSPNNGSALVEFLKSKGFSEEELKLAGLTSKSYRGGVQDMFRGRLQIPLADPQGRIIGFTARLLADDPQAPKYINTPSTPIYDKSRHVYGLHLAKEAIRKTKFVVLAEGNLDVIASYQAGVRQVVATAGTALTEPHLKALNRLTGDIRLCFDADKAGVAATERAIPVAAKVGVSLQIITIPSGKDPDELIKQNVNVWKETIEKPQYVVDWLIDRYTEELDLTTAVGKRKLSDVVLRVVRQLPDKVEQDHFVGRLAKLLQVSKDALQDKLRHTADETVPARRHHVEPPTNAVVDKALQDKKRIEEHLMALTLMLPKMRSYLYSLDPEMFDFGPTRAVFEFLAEHPDFDGKDTKQAKKIAEYGKILSLVFETLYQDIDQAELTSEARRLQASLVSQYVRMQKQTIVEQLQTAEPKEADQLLMRARDLDLLLRTEQEGTERGTEER
jgi:DNA primase